jgi:hypothetical protein
MTASPSKRKKFNDHLSAPGVGNLNDQRSLGAAKSERPALPSGGQNPDDHRSLQTAEIE